MCDVYRSLSSAALYRCQNHHVRDVCSFKAMEDFLTHDRSSSCLSLHLSLIPALSTARKRLIQFASRNEFVYRHRRRVELELGQNQEAIGHSGIPKDHRPSPALPTGHRVSLADSLCQPPHGPSLTRTRPLPHSPTWTLTPWSQLRPLALYPSFQLQLYSPTISCSRCFLVQILERSDKNGTASSQLNSLIGPQPISGHVPPFVLIILTG